MGAVCVDCVGSITDETPTGQSASKRHKAANKVRVCERIRETMMAVRDAPKVKF